MQVQPPMKLWGILGLSAQKSVPKKRKKMKKFIYLYIKISIFISIKNKYIHILNQFKRNSLNSWSFELTELIS